MTDEQRLQKNKQIKETRKATAECRLTQFAMTFTLKVRNEKRNIKNKVFCELQLLFAEAKWVRNSLIAQLNAGRKISEFSYKDFKSVVHYDKDKKEIVSEVKLLRTSMRDEVVIEVKNNIRALSALKKTGKTVGRLKFESDHKRIHLRQYKVTHDITGPNTIRIQGLSHEVRVAGLRQLRTLDKAGIEYEITTADIIKKDDDFYVNITVFVDKDVWNAYQENKRNKRNAKRKNLTVYDINALDMGCLKTATDAYGRVYNSTVEETERLKRLQQKLQRQKKGSNNRKKTLKQLHREYEKNDNLKEQKAIELVNEVLDTTKKLIILDENLTGWKKKHGKKVHHGILGRVKQRLVKSDKVHVIDRFVPTTKLCTNCGHMHSAITVRERTFVCPNCGHDDGERDTHSAKDMIWLYQNMKKYMGLDGSEFKRCEFDEALKERFVGR